MEALKRARKAKGMTLAQVAEATGLHEVSIARAERDGYDPKWSTVVALARALGVHICELIEEGERHDRHAGRRRRRKPTAT